MQLHSSSNWASQQQQWWPTIKGPSHGRQIMAEGEGQIFLVFPKGDEIISREAGSDRLPSTKKRIAARNWTETENQAARHAFGFVGGREKNNQRPDNRPIFYRSFVIEREDNSGRN